MITCKEFITEKEIEELLNSSNNSLKTFRYFNTRSTSIVNTHKYNVICYYNSYPVSYGHLDLDKNFKLWLGIFVSDDYQGMGFGKETIKILLNKFNTFSDKKLYLSVDENNLKARSLYEKFGFVMLDAKNNTVYYILNKE